MYIPKHFLATDREESISFMREYNFATIITGKDEIPIATHLPFVIERRGDDIVLCSHFAKQNPQWKQVADNNVLVIFTEPHAYVSPKFYSKELNVPTWNYLSVHAYGKGVILEDSVAAFALLEKMIESFESDYKNQWQQLSADYKMNMVKGIVPFEIHVRELQFKKKLSQNKADDERMRIIDAFDKSDSENERTISEYMKSVSHYE